ncbi:MAG: type IV pilin-like G/H family protein [Potamolinea sp.]
MLQTERVLQERYQLKQLLGHNAGRQTWLAEDLETQPRESVIVKLLAFNPQMHWDELKLFEREAQVLKNINHPRIPKYHDYFSIDKEMGDGLPWFGLVQEYIPGESLQQLLEQGKSFSETQVRQIAIEVLNILIYLHELSPPVFHRDLKPSNLILGKNDRVYLVDFGAVQDKATAEGVTFTVVGTSGYTPPEQLWGKAVAASDLYALGATLIHLLTGISPAELQQDNLRIQFAEKIKLDADFTDWLYQLTDPSSERRYSTARQTLKYLQAPRSVTPPIEEIETIPIFVSNTGWVVPVVVGTVGILGSMAFLFLGNPASCGNKAKQSEGKTMVGSMNRAQQAYYLENDKFTNSFDELGLGIATQTDNYSYSVRVTPKAVYNYGTPRKNTLKSYVGVVFVSRIETTGEQTTRAILCEAKSPGTKLPKMPSDETILSKETCGPDMKNLGK